MVREKEYTLAFLFNKTLDKVLMLHKDRGLYSGHMNGLGGKVELYDTSWVRAVSREIEEEAGVKIPVGNFTYLMTCRFANETILHVFTVAVDEDSPKQCESERLEWVAVNEILATPVNDDCFAGEGNVQFFVNVAWKTLNGLITPTTPVASRI